MNMYLLIPYISKSPHTLAGDSCHHPDPFSTILCMLPQKYCCCFCYITFQQTVAPAIQYQISQSQHFLPYQRESPRLPLVLDRGKKQFADFQKTFSNELIPTFHSSLELEKGISQ